MQHDKQKHLSSSTIGVFKEMKNVLIVFESVYRELLSYYKLSNDCNASKNSQNTAFCRL